MANGLRPNKANLREVLGKKKGGRPVNLPDGNKAKNSMLQDAKLGKRLARGR